MDKLLFDEQGYPYVKNFCPSFEEKNEGPVFKRKEDKYE